VEPIRNVDRQSWKQYLFYIDMVVWAILAASVAYVIGNVYRVGIFLGRGDMAANQASWWQALTGFAFMMAAMSWVFFRFWKNGFLAIKRPF
jgi:hypothetical protein